jgi:hypothetical protein
MLLSVIGGPHEARFPSRSFVQFTGVSDVIFKLAVALG